MYGGNSITTLIKGRHVLIMNGDEPMWNSEGLLVQDVQSELLH